MLFLYGALLLWRRHVNGYGAADGSCVNARLAGNLWRASVGRAGHRQSVGGCGRGFWEAGRANTLSGGNGQVYGSTGQRQKHGGKHQYGKGRQYQSAVQRRNCNLVLVDDLHEMIGVKRSSRHVNQE